MKTENAIVAYLGKHPGASAGDIKDGIGSRRETISKQALYRHLRDLIAEGIAVKVGQQYFLRLAWIIESLASFEDMRARYFMADSIRSTLPSGSRPAKLVFNNLHQADLYWTQLMLLLLGSQSPNTYQWIPHPWWMLIHPEREEEFLRAISVSKYQLTLIFGESSPLDQAYWKMLPVDSHRWSSAAGPYSNQREYLTVIGDFVHRLVLPPKLAVAIERIFVDARSLAEALSHPAMRILKGEAPIQSSLKYGPSEAQRIRREFREYFGDIELKEA